MACIQRLKLKNVSLSSVTYYPRRPAWTTLTDILDPLVSLKVLELTDVFASGELLINVGVLFVDTSK